MSGSSMSTQQLARPGCGPSSPSNASARSLIARGPHGLGLGDRVVRLLDAAVEGELAGLLDVAAQLAVQGAQREVGEIEGALVRAQQVGGELGVAR